MREAPIQSLILDYLAAEHILAFRMNTGQLKVDGRFVRFGVPGMADILAFPYGAVLWIEVKSATGRQRAEQKSFGEQVTGVGHEYLLARNLETVIFALARIKDDAGRTRLWDSSQRTCSLT